MFSEFKKYVVFAVTLFVIVISTNANNINIISESNTLNTRTKRFNDLLHHGQGWTRENEYYPDISRSYHQNYQNTLNYQHGIYNQRQDLNHEIQSRQIPQNYNPYVTNQVPIPPQTHFNGQQDNLNNRISISTSQLFLIHNIIGSQPYSDTINQNIVNPQLALTPNILISQFPPTSHNTHTQLPLTITNTAIYSQLPPKTNSIIPQFSPTTNTITPQFPSTTNTVLPQFPPTTSTIPQFPPASNVINSLENVSRPTPTSNTSPNRVQPSINPNIFGNETTLEGLTMKGTGPIFGEIDDISCDQPYVPPNMPNFETPGRKISETRCFEYIFQLKVKSDLERRNRACNNQNLRAIDRTFRPLRQTNPNFVEDGRGAEGEEFSHMVAIGWRGRNEPLIFKCGASLISPNFLLTTAYCSISAPDPELIDLIPRVARIGGNTIGYSKSGEAYVESSSSNKKRRRQTSNPNQIDVGIINIIPHENYDPNMKYFDIALMQLAYSLDFNRRFRPACLWGDGEATNRIRRAVATGWEVMNPSTGRISSKLQAGDLDIINVTTCNNLLRGKFGNQFNEFQDHQLCAGKLSGEIDICQGDSGGPLQLGINLPGNSIRKMHVIVGVVAAAPDCKQRNVPGIYTKVSSFVDWIEVKVWGQ